MENPNEQYQPSIEAQQLEYTKGIYQEIRALKRLHYWQFALKILIPLVIILLIVWAASSAIGFVTDFISSNNEIFSNLSGSLESIQNLSNSQSEIKSLLENVGSNNNNVDVKGLIEQYLQ